jgi:hypothetical protein
MATDAWSAPPHKRSITIYNLFWSALTPLSVRFVMGRWTAKLRNESILKELAKAFDAEYMAVVSVLSIENGDSPPRLNPVA